MELDATAQHLVNERGFIRSCVVLETRRGTQKQRPVMLATTHFMDPVPTEIHGFGIYGPGFRWIFGRRLRHGVEHLERAYFSCAERRSQVIARAML